MAWSDDITNLKPLIKNIYDTYVLKGTNKNEFIISEPEVPKNPQSVAENILSIKKLFYATAWQGHKEGTKIANSVYEFECKPLYVTNNYRIKLNIMGVCDIYIDDNLIYSLDSPSENTLLSFSSTTYNFISSSNTIKIIGYIKQVYCGTDMTTSGGAEKPCPQIVTILQWPYSLGEETSEQMFYFQSLKDINFNFPPQLTKFSYHTFYYSKLNGFTIPRQITNIAANAFEQRGSVQNPTLTFEHSEIDPIVIEPGSFTVKNADQYTIYTDSPIIKNYDWAADNITATFYHLDGTIWEEEINANNQT